MRPHAAKRALACVAALVFAAGCSAQKKLERGLAGTWQDMSGASTTIAHERRSAVVTQVIDYDAERFVVTGSGWQQDVFCWDYQVPSTGYLVRHCVTGFSEQGLSVIWQNDRGDSGVDYLVRIE